MSGSNRQQTLKQMGGSSSTSSQPTGFNLRPGIRNYIYFVLAWSILSHLIVITGIWTIENSNADTVFTTLSIIFPGMGIVFLSILDN